MLESTGKCLSCECGNCTNTCYGISCTSCPNYPIVLECGLSGLMD